MMGRFSKPPAEQPAGEFGKPGRTRRLPSFVTYGGLILMLIGSLDVWIRRDVGKLFSGIQWPLLGDFATTPHFVPASFGCLLAGFCLVWLALGRVLGARTSTLAAVVVLCIGAAVPLEIAFGNPLRLRDLLEDNTDSGEIYKFNHSLEDYANTGKLPSTSALPVPATMLDRFTSAAYFLGRGWYTAMVGALFIAFWGLVVSGPARVRILVGTVSIALCAGVCALFLVKPSVGQRYLTLALAAQAGGNFDLAASRYRIAMAWDSWHSSDAELQRRLGEMDALQNRRDTPEFHLYRGSLYQDKNSYETALFHYRAAARSPRLARVAAKSAAEACREYGKSIAPVSPSSAVAIFTEAHNFSPERLQTHFLLGATYLKCGDYPQTVIWMQRVLNMAKPNTPTAADACSTLADAYEKLGQGALARTYYARALKYDDESNARAFGALTGR